VVLQRRPQISNKRQIKMWRRWPALCKKANRGGSTRSSHWGKTGGGGGGLGPPRERKKVLEGLVGRGREVRNLNREKPQGREEMQLTIFKEGRRSRSGTTANEAKRGDKLSTSGVHKRGGNTGAKKKKKDRRRALRSIPKKVIVGRTRAGTAGGGGEKRYRMCWAGKAW